MLKQHAMEEKFDSKHFNNSNNKHKSEKKKTSMRNKHGKQIDKID
jgi:hypothetical protein